ncbi:hypothetical protein PP175_00445 [Aneurinibacillus sp. Ricciae_BoGa-3]|uniref:hypothetical protein n=1 Tax=Aneurinibacillus sp. Ricciae_BoGa-3 TaxID=3022697 RepID=UPI0023400B62|nr:hypothetical protein [Aneurinibacillus sp. Ricciae_BoGa-3]WCK54583.1 hypothetical protein PP175_00445 [Aneurinibacillus sp. Ricciae_BoGa-3]
MQEIAVGTDKEAQSAEQTSQTVKEMSIGVTSSAPSLSKMAEELQMLIGKFKI